MTTMPTINLPEGPVTMRRLGIDDPFHMLEIMAAAVDVYAADQSYRVVPLRLDTPEGKARFAMLGLQSTRETAIPWLGTLISKSPEEMRNPEVVPLTVLPELLAAVLAHPDVLGLVDSLSKLAQGESVQSLLARVKGGDGDE